MKHFMRLKQVLLYIICYQTLQYLNSVTNMKPFIKSRGDDR